MLESIIEILKQYTEVEEKLIVEEAQLQADLDLNSLDVMNIVVDFEDAFNIQIPDEDVKGFQTVEDIRNYLEQKISK